MFPTTKPSSWVSSYHPPSLLCVSLLCPVDTILIEPLDSRMSTRSGKYVHMYVHRVIKHMRTFPSILINNARNVAEGGIQIPVTVSGALLLLPSSPTNHRKGHTEEGLFLIRMRSSVVVGGGERHKKWLRKTILPTNNNVGPQSWQQEMNSVHAASTDLFLCLPHSHVPIHRPHVSLSLSLLCLLV